jgi:hypothetical protein
VIAASAAATSAGTGCGVGAAALADAGVELAGGGAEPADDEEFWARAGVERTTRAVSKAKRAKRNTNSLKDQFSGRSLTGTDEYSTRDGRREPGTDRASKSDQTRTHKKVQSQTRRWTMPEQFENLETAKLEDETFAEESADKKVERVAEKAARKGTKTEQEYDKEHNIFTI